MANIFFKKTDCEVNVGQFQKTTSIKHKTDYWWLTLQSKRVPRTPDNYQNADSGMDE